MDPGAFSSWVRYYFKLTIKSLWATLSAPAWGSSSARIILYWRQMKSTLGSINTNHDI